MSAWVAVFSVGAFDAEVPSHVYTHNYLTAADLRSLRADGAVGDVCTVFLRADGTLCARAEALWIALPG